MSFMDRLAVSATGGDDKKPLDEVLPSYSAMGFRYFEAWLHGRGSALDLSRGADYYNEKIRQYGMLGFSSLHMSSIEKADDASLQQSLRIVEFAETLGITTLTFNASGKDVYIEGVKRLLNELDGRKLTLVCQVHEGRSIGTFDDLTEVLDVVGDPRLQIQHEVGSFYAMGITWKEVCDRFAGRIGLVHVKDMIGSQSVPLGSGEIELPELFAYLEGQGYDGFYVVEIAPRDRENTNRYFAEAFHYLEQLSSQ